MTRTDTTLDQDRKTDAAVSVCAPCNVVTLSGTIVNFNTPPLTVIATLMQDSCAKRGSTNRLTFLRFVRMTFAHRLKFHTKKRKIRSHPAECESFTTRQFCQPIFVQPIQCVNSVKCISFHQSRASKRPTAHVRAQPSREIRAHPSDPSSRCRGLFK